LRAMEYEFLGRGMIQHSVYYYAILDRLSTQTIIEALS
jgi:hypothetical protein